MINNFLTALSAVSPQNALLITTGVVIGLIFGAIPGLSTTMAVALFLPITFAMKMSSVSKSFVVSVQTLLQGRL